MAYMRATRLRYGLLATLMLALSACMASVDSRTWAKAEELCEPNGGVDKISLEFVYCNSGAQFKR